MSIAQLFAPKPAPKVAPDTRDEVIRTQKQMIAKLRGEVDRLKHMRSGTYTFRIEDVRDLARAVTAIEIGDKHGLRLLVGVMDDLRPDWREIC